MRADTETEQRTAWVLLCRDCPDGHRPRGRPPTEGCGRPFPIATRRKHGQWYCPNPDCRKRTRAVLTGGGSDAVYGGPYQTRQEAVMRAALAWRDMEKAAAIKERLA